MTDVRVVKYVVRGAVTDVALALIWVVVVGSNASVVVVVVTVWERLSIGFSKLLLIKHRGSM